MQKNVLCKFNAKLKPLPVEHKFYNYKKKFKKQKRKSFWFYLVKAETPQQFNKRLSVDDAQDAIMKLSYLWGGKLGMVVVLDGIICMVKI